MSEYLVRFNKNNRWSECHQNYIDICDDNYRSAVMLHEIESYLHFKCKGGNGPWPMSESLIKDRCRITIAHTAYMRALDIITSKGYISISIQKGRTQSIRFNTDIVQQAIDNLPLIPNLVGNDQVPSRKRLSTSSETTKYLVGNDYIEYVSTLKDGEYPESLNAYALTSYGGSVGDRLRDDCQPAILNIECSNESEIALELKNTVCPVSDGNVDILLPIPGPAEINKPMTSHEVVQSMLAEYAKLPNSIKDHRQKGSAVALFRKFGDLLVKTVGNDGESAIAAFSSFLADDFWKSQGWPFFAFVSQYNEFLVKGGGDGTEIQTDSVTPRKNSKFATSSKPSAPGISSKFPARNYDEPAQRYIPTYVPDVNAKARHKRDEALTLLQSANTPMFNTCMDELYGPITDPIRKKIDSWHEAAVAEFRDKLKREPIVKCLYKVSE